MTDTRLLRILRLLYHQGRAEVRQIEAELIEVRKRAWVTAIEAEARRWGYSGPANAPRLEDLESIRTESRADAQSIVQTWNRDVDRQLDKLYARNYRGNRYYYRKHMEDWASAREVWKSRQIANQTEMSTANYARRRFEEMNGLRGGLSVFDGPPPVCGECTELYNMGPVAQSVVDKYPCPRHINCTHYWTKLTSSVNAPAVEDLWVG
jgi:hypothetical protein